MEMNSPWIKLKITSLIVNMFLNIISMPFWLIFQREALSNQMYSIDKMAASGIYALLALVVLTIIVILLLTTSKEMVIIS